MKNLAKAINSAFFKAYPEALDVFTNALDEKDEKILIKRVNMLLDDLLCTRINWHTAEKAYNKLDHEKRHIRWHWWEFWKEPRGDKRSF
jgi:hypothetical protein